MNLHDISDTSPFVRMIKIKKSVHLEGAWEDLDHLLIYIAHGSLDYMVEGTRYNLTAGDFILIPPYMHHLVVKSSSEPVEQYMVHFDFYSDPDRMQIQHQSAQDLKERPALPSQENILNGKPLTGTIRTQSRYLFEKVFMSMYWEYFQQEIGYETMMKGLTIQLLTVIGRELPGLCSAETRTGIRKSKSWILVENALEYIYIHYSEDLDNKKISDAVNVSPNYLSKLFQTYIGMSLHNYLLNYRLEKAQQLIISNKCNITEAALKCGFSSVHTFSKIFKQKRGITPSEYADRAEEKAVLLKEEAGYCFQKPPFLKG